MRKRIASLIAVGLATIGSPALADAYALDWWTIDGGGTTGTVGAGGYVLSGSIGQPDASGPITGGPYQVQGGFWAARAQGTSGAPETQPGGGVADGSPGPALRLRGSTPNPFHAEAKVFFELPSRQTVSLAIFDPAGRLCRTLIEGGLEAGTHARVWDGRDNAGRTLASGIYFAVLRTPAGERREKLVKVR